MLAFPLDFLLSRACVCTASERITVGKNTREVAIGNCLQEIHAQLSDATSISKAAKACAGTGHFQKSIEIMLDVEPILYPDRWLDHPAPHARPAALPRRKARPSSQPDQPLHHRRLWRTADSRCFHRRQTTAHRFPTGLICRRSRFPFLAEISPSSDLVEQVQREKRQAPVQVRKA